MHEYYTLKPHLILKEYGRNIQKLVEYVVNIEDREKRTASATTLVELMKQINASNGQSREQLDNEQKYWDDLYIMSGFTLDVDSPFPMPEKEVLGKKPKLMTYSTNHIRYKHYGKNIELMIRQAIELEDPEEKQAAIITIGRLMKSFYNTWNKDNISDELIIKNITDLSKGELKVELDENQDGNMFEPFVKEYRPRPNRNQSRRPNNQNQKRRRNQN